MLPFKVLDFNSQNSEQLFLTSTVVGYLFYLLAGMISVLTNHFKNTPSFFRVIFVFITLYAVYFETAAIIIAFHSEFSGQHLWVGTALFLYGLLIIFYKTKPVSVKGKVKTDRIKFMSDPK